VPPACPRSKATGWNADDRDATPRINCNQSNLSQPTSDVGSLITESENALKWL